MFDPRIVTALRRAARPASEVTDAALLARFAAGRDPAAFAELLARHGPAVWAVCRRQVGTAADAEDVFQAVFLVLARDAARVRKAASVGSWLHGVACRVGRRARQRRDRAPDPARLHAPAAPDPADALSWAEVRAALDEELARLPDPLRAPILLCYFDGLTQDEAAARLGWNPRTVKARVARGRALLRSRLSHRGVELPAALAVPLLSAGAGAVPQRLPAALAAAAADFARGRPPGPDIPPAAVALAHAEGPAVSVLRLAVLLASAAGLSVAGALARPAAPPDPPAARPADPAPGAVRIGTTQFRQTGWHARAYFADGGKTVVTAGEGVSVRFWDLDTGTVRDEIKLEGAYDDAAFAPGGNLLAVVGSHWPKGKDADWESAVWLVDVASRKLVRTVGLPANRGGNDQQVVISADGKRVVVEYEGDVRVIEAKSGEVLTRHKGRINAGVLAATADAKLVVIGRYDLYLWAWETGEEPKKFADLGGFGTDTVLFGPDAKTLYVSSRGRALTFDVATGRQTGILDLGAAPRQWSFSPDGKTLAVSHYRTTKAGGSPNAVALWDVATGKQTGRLPVGRTEATLPNWSADGTRLATTTDHRVWAWDVKTGKQLGPAAPGHEGGIGGFAFAPDGRLFTASDDHTIRTWDPATGKPGLELVHDSWVRGMALSPDGSLVAGSALDNDLRLWDAKTGAERYRLLGNGRQGGTRKVRFTPDGKRLVAWGDDLYLRVWEVRNGKLLAEHRTVPDGKTEADLDDPGRRDFLFLMADVSPDGSTFALCQHEAVQIFDVVTGKERAKFEADPNGVTALGLSADGKRLAVAGRNKSVETRLPEGRFGHKTDPDYRLAVWDVAAKAVVWEKNVPGSAWGGEVRFSDDGSRLAGSGSVDEKKYVAWVWDAAGGKDLGRIDLPGAAHHLGFDRAGKRLAVSHPDTTATVYDLDAVLKPAPK
jgi:RNA polymerase sigma factor (sigma-70 family)